MSRRAARFTQAEAARFARVAANLGPAWRVLAVDGVLQLVQNFEGPPMPSRPRNEEQAADPAAGRGLALVP